MRGTRALDVNLDNISGIIPAYAGNTAAAGMRHIGFRDHPRVCGEHVTVPSLLLYVGGSSPRMRGTLHEITSLVIVQGIIPAYAGNTEYFCSAMLATWDHPRVCGEHRVGAVRIDCTPGIIPAYAGNTTGR